MTPETEALIARLEALHKNASPALFDGTATPRGLGLLLRCGAANQKPRADNWDNLDFEADGKCLLGVAVAAPQLFATIREQATEIAHLADQLDGCQHNWKQVTAENAKLRAEIERSEALQDLAYIHGAQQYASIADAHKALGEQS